MGILLTSFLRIAAQVLAGVGIGELLDKFVKPKIPAYYPEPISPGFRLPKLAWFVLAFVIGIMALRFVGRKLRIKLLK
jgi:hypothetical protein